MRKPKRSLKPSKTMFFKSNQEDLLMEEFQINTQSPPARASKHQYNMLLSVSVISAIGAAIGIAGVTWVVLQSREKSPSESRLEDVEKQRKLGGFLGAMAPKTGGNISVEVVNEPQLEISFRNVVLNFDVTNNSRHAISSLSGELQLIETGRTVPLGTAKIWVSIPGGIETGETKSFSTTAFEAETLMQQKGEWRFCLTEIVSENTLFSTSQGFVAVSQNKPNNAFNQQFGVEALLNLKPPQQQQPIQAPWNRQ